MTHFITRKALSRRHLLRGAGTLLALPLLESMLPAGLRRARAAEAPPCRLGCLYFPHGATMSRWTPAEQGPDFPFSEILEPLEPFRQRLMVFSNLGLPLAYGPGGATGNHNRSSASFLSGAKAASGARPRLGVTLDQVAAAHIGQDTPLPSLELMIEGSSLSCGEGLSCAYQNTIAWQDEFTPLPMQNNPQVVFEQLFGDGATAAQRDARRDQSLSLLDAAREEIAALQKTLPAADRLRLDQYLNDVREVERRIAQAGERLTPELELPEQPSGIPQDIEAHIKLMYDLLVLAWQTDITRVSTFLIAKELSNAVYPNSGVRDSFHILSHHSNNEENKRRFARLNRYHVSLFGYFLERLAATPDGDGNLLDHAMILYGSGMSDGNSHNHDPLPVLLAGGACGGLPGNRHLAARELTPLANLQVAMLEILGIGQERFGDSSGRLSIS